MELVEGLVGAELVELSNTIFTKAFEVGSITELFTVSGGVREGNVVPIISNSPNYASFPYKNPLDCTIPVCDLDINFSAKVWQLGMIACTIPICINTFDEDFLLFWKVYRKTFGEESDVDTALMQFLIDRFQSNLEAALWRVVFFGDRSISASDPNYDLMRPIDGIFTQVEAGEGIKIVVPANTDGTSLTGQELYDILSNAYNRATLETDWYDDTTAQFIMTKAMASVLVTWLNSLKDTSMYNCECLDADSVTKKRSFSINDKLFVFGIPITVRPELDGVIRQLGLGYPYRALLTSKDNILVGTGEVSKMSQFDVWYERKDNMIYMRGGANIGVSVATDEYIYIGAETASPLPPTSVSLTPATANLEQGDTLQLTATISPAEAPDTVTYEVLPAGQGVTVNGTGLVTATGSATLGAYTVWATTPEGVRDSSVITVIVGA